jgi:hypothetical protein
VQRVPDQRRRQHPAGVSHGVQRGRCATDDTARGINTTAALKGFSTAHADRRVRRDGDDGHDDRLHADLDDRARDGDHRQLHRVRRVRHHGSLGSFANAAATTQNVTVNTGFGQPDLVFTSGAMIDGARRRDRQHELRARRVHEGGAARSTYVVESDGNTAMTLGHRQLAIASDYTADQVSIAYARRDIDPVRVGSWPTDGFQLTYSSTPSTARQTLYLAIKTTAPVTLSSASSPTATSLTQSLSHGAKHSAGRVVLGRPAADECGGGHDGDGPRRLVHGRL